MRLNVKRDSWLIAWALTLLLHAGAILYFRSLPPPRRVVTVQRPQPIRFVFAGYKPETRRTEEPHQFSELPPERADAAPKKADFLSNVTSRARDPVGGGESALPRMQGEGDVPLVGLDPGGGPSSPPTAPVSGSRPGEAASTPAVASTQRSADPAQPHPGAGAPAASANPADRGAGSSSSEIIRANPGAAGNSDLYQPEMANPAGSAALLGDVSLNTTAWDYAPWLQRFERQLLHRWFAPPAYALGMLKEGGWALFDVEITRSGKMVRLDMLEAQGHPSLSQAARFALDSMAPIEPLPANFPEPTLILRIRMIYPKIPRR